MLAGLGAATGGGPDGCSIYVGNLEPRVCTELLEEIFSLVGRIKLCKVVADRQTGMSLGFGFVDFYTRDEALRALTRLNGRILYGQELKVDWAHTGTGAAGKSAPGGEDISTHYALFVGNVSAEIDDAALIEAFGRFGTSMSSAKVSRDTDMQSLGFGFVTYREKQDADDAIAGMNNTVLGMKALRVDWARAKVAGRPGDPGGRMGDGSTGGLARYDYDTIVNQTPPMNVTVYIAGLPATIDEATLQATMAQYGEIDEVKIPEVAKTSGNDRAYAFVKFRTHHEAAKAIVGTQGTEVMGRIVTAQWGRESNRRPRMLGPGMPLPAGFYGMHSGAPVPMYGVPPAGFGMMPPPFGQLPPG
eukprot:CAMPEP_0184682866 /NCGR_PEP_ID=MMETSP0312-20130426/9058_1 /TAXON_ID=31354 /ORGANISM="Compsopogon coeruleus, Strain SAG 36.94" /LENGTH=358 /DNA_ID=CAMNT_0027134817 /DNA_START=45 /DNA_END=1121 /DNA_ORIENTATION=+